MIKAGTYKAEVVACFTGESKEKKTPYYGIEFEFETGESLEWVAYLTENTKERYLATLNDMGFKGNRISDMSDPKKILSDLFGQPTDDIYIVVEIESYDKDNGEKGEKPKIAFVNVGRQSSFSKHDHVQSVAIFKSLPYDGDLARIRREGPKKIEKKSKEKPAEEEQNFDTKFDSDDIPF